MVSDDIPDADVDADDLDAGKVEVEEQEESDVDDMCDPFDTTTTSVH